MRKNWLELPMKPCTVKYDFQGSSLSTLQPSKVKSVDQEIWRKYTEASPCNMLSSPSPSPRHTTTLPYLTFNHTLHPSSSCWIVSIKHKEIVASLHKLLFFSFSTQMISYLMASFPNSRESTSLCIPWHAVSSALPLSPILWCRLPSVSYTGIHE